MFRQIGEDKQDNGRYPRDIVGPPRHKYHENIEWAVEKYNKAKGWRNKNVMPYRRRKKEEDRWSEGNDSELAVSYWLDWERNWESHG